MTAVLLSGGLDSTTALALAHADRVDHDGGELLAVSVDYGQRHRRELESAKAVASHYRATQVIVDARDGFLSGSALLGAVDVPDGRYDDEVMRQTVVPGRNLLLIAVAVAQAVQHGHDRLLVGVHAGDHPIYPDCRATFIDPLRRAVLAGYEVALEAPFIALSKADIVSVGAELDVPYGLTWSCYKGGDVHCGRCGTCVERIEAFKVADVPDPTAYADTDFAETVL